MFCALFLEKSKNKVFAIAYEIYPSQKKGGKTVANNVAKLLSKIHPKHLPPFDLLKPTNVATEVAKQWQQKWQNNST